ncbi:MAG TPA: radical SAM family heme chaperone HemW [Chitinivibrionales bacterium]|nr:radical SAM family heme chaperone HemW [Chitinivibrionales bacterium]
MANPSLSLYVHVPFCVKKCLYCDFYSVPYEKFLADDFIQTVVKEWALVKKEKNLEDPTLQTLFIGGGTPSVLSVEQWKSMHRALTSQFNLAQGIEWTIECNPDSFTQEKAQLWHSMGVTRLAFGVQSFVDEELRILGRPHFAGEAFAALHSPALRQFNSIGLDIMYGLPNQTIDSFEKTLAAALSAQIVKHLSAYELTICENSPFGREKNLPLPDEDTVCDMARLIFRKCREAGFERYEISNFAKEGHRCRHNEAYWNHEPYIGLGPGAHSYVHPKRWANIGDVKKYVSMINDGKRAIDFEETIDKKKLADEMIFLSLRTSDGLDEKNFSKNTGEQFYSGNRKKVLEDMLREKLIIHEKSRWSLTEKGMLLTDSIVKKLI